MDNYQLMKVVELELRKQQKRIRRRQREEERERRKVRRTSRDAGGSSNGNIKQSGYRREPPLPTTSSPGHASSAVGLPPLSFVGLRRTSNGGGGPGGDSEWSGSEDVQSHFMIQRDIIPSPTTSECNFMSDDEFRGEFRFGDEDFAENDGDEEEWERSDDDDLDDTDEETDEEDDYYEEEDDDEGTPRHSVRVCESSRSTAFPLALRFGWSRSTLRLTRRGCAVQGGRGGYLAAPVSHARGWPTPESTRGCRRTAKRRCPHGQVAQVGAEATCPRHAHRTLSPSRMHPRRQCAIQFSIKANFLIAIGRAEAATTGPTAARRRTNCKHARP
jgi:hypothetical protein